METSAIVVLADGVFSIPRSKVSLIELIRHNCDNSNELTFRYIKTELNSSDLSVRLTDRLEELICLRERCSKGTVYILCGLQECISGYSAPLFHSHLSGIVSELRRINYEVIFINCEIINGLKGKTGGWFKRSTQIISTICQEHKINEIIPQISLKVEENTPVLGIEATRDIVSEICYDIAER